MTIAGILLVIIALLWFVYYGIPYLSGRLSCELLDRRARSRRVLALTFDDGPSSRLTTSVLELLAEHHAPATFFMLGKNVQGQQQLVKRAADLGHQICSHGYDHINYLHVSPFRALADIRRGWEAIYTVLGKSKGVYSFRPPYGKLNIVCLLYLLIQRVPIVYWSLDAGDTRRSGEFDADQAAQLVRRQGGGVLLLHDFDRSDERVNGNVIECLSRVLSVAEAEGIRFIKVSELLSL